MSLKTVTVTGTLRTPGGQPVAGAAVRADLTRQEIDDGIVVPTAVETITAADGTFALELWPNARGVAGSQYRVHSIQAYVRLLDVLITVPDVDVPTAIEQVIDQAPYPAVSAAQAAQQAAQQAAVLAQAAESAAAAAADSAVQSATDAQSAATTAADDIVQERWQIAENNRRVLIERYGDGPYPGFDIDFRGAAQ